MRIIDADALLDDCIFSSKEFEKMMREFIGDAPTIEPEYRCRICNRLNNIKIYDYYCPECGIKMKEVIINDK